MTKQRMEAISVFDIFKIGVGPSSSHTMGPWRAAQRFLEICRQRGLFSSLVGIQVDLYGSLAKTGKGHGTDIALMMGLSGEDPATCDTATIPQKIGEIRASRSLDLSGTKSLAFDPESDLVFHRGITLPFHPNGMKFTARLKDHSKIEETYYSIGGGFITRENEPAGGAQAAKLPMPIDTAADLLRYCREHGLTPPEVVRRNESTWRGEAEVHQGLRRIWDTMRQCVFRGCHSEGTLPGGLGVTRRAAALNRALLGGDPYGDADSWMAAVRERRRGFQDILQWVSCFALAVNEENASFGRVVTAPTNGAAGVIPAVLMYHVCFGEADAESVEEFLLTAGEIGSLFKKGSTLSAAMGGCQAEIGVSSAMAAAALAHCQGASVDKVMMAAEIAMEHHLGLTCDPVGGLVQIPCIERNTMGAIKAITACQLALVGNPAQAKVTLDAVIKSMWETALDMNTKYKETSEGGLALNIPVNVTEC